MTNTIRRFTLPEVLEVAAVESTTMGYEFEEGPTNLTSRKRGGWAGLPFSEGMRMARWGDPDSAARIKLRADGLTAAIRDARRPVTRWDVSGSQVDVARFMSGEPECMGEIVRTTRQSPLVKIAVERAVSSGTDTEDIRATGASVLVAIDALRNCGVPAEVWATFTVTRFDRISGESHYWTAEVLLQEAARPVNMDVLGFWVVREEALRRVIFSVMENEPKAIRNQFNFTNRGNYSTPSNVKYADKDFDEYAPATRDAATRWLRDVLTRRAGITIEATGEGDNDD